MEGDSSTLILKAIIYHKPFVRKKCIFDINIHSVSIFLNFSWFPWEMKFSVLFIRRFCTKTKNYIVFFLTSGRFLERFLPYRFIFSFHLQEYFYMIFVHTPATFHFSYFYWIVTISCQVFIFFRIFFLGAFVVILLILIFTKIKYNF